MSSISGISSVAQSSVSSYIASQQKAAASTKRDSDGDFDGTRVGQADPKDFGKGQQIDTLA